MVTATVTATETVNTNGPGNGGGYCIGNDNENDNDAGNGSGNGRSTKVTVSASSSDRSPLVRRLVYPFVVARPFLAKECLVPGMCFVIVVSPIGRGEPASVASPDETINNHNPVSYV